MSLGGGRKKFSRGITAILALALSVLIIQPATAKTARSRAKVPLKVLLERFQESAGAFDPLTLRIFIKKISVRPLSMKQWSEIRRYLILNPQVGYDLVYKWEKIRPAEPAQKDKEISLNAAIEKADQLSIDEKFAEAFKIYQQTALFLKSEIKKGKKENLFLYSVMLHSMGRTLFATGRYDDALQVYSWIPKNYPRFRQVIFEKMWTAFQAGRIDVALGAIASQESSYFAGFLEPETYLIKTYIFKRLCRDEDLKDLRRKIQILKTRIEKGDKKFYMEWAQSDIELLSLSRLTLLDPDEDTSSEVTKADRSKEIETIRKILGKKFEIEVKRLQRDLTSILAFSNIALGSKDFAFVKHEEIDHSKLMARGDEIWAVNDAEDWVDEIGGHLFIGESLCKTQSAASAKK
jgi:tetratricopeptide (TPR) repeat protein